MASLSCEQLIERCKSLPGERQQLTQTNIALKKEFEKMMLTEAIELSDSQSEVMLRCVHNLEQVWDKDTPEQLLWDEQMKAIKHKKHMRWHPYLGDPLFLTWNDVLHFGSFMQGNGKPREGATVQSGDDVCKEEVHGKVLLLGGMKHFDESKKY